MAPLCSVGGPLPLSSLFLVTLLAGLNASSALRFYLQDRERRCFKFDAPYASRVIGERAVTNGKGTAELLIEVKSATSGKVIYESHSSDPKNSKFGFQTPDYYEDAGHMSDADDYDYDDYEGDATYHVCLMLTFDTAMHTSGKRAVSFWIRAEGPHYKKGLEKRATEDTMGTISRALQEMQSTLQNIISDLASLQQRERRLVKRSESTGQRLSVFAIVGLVVVLATSTLQFMHYKTFFKSKKLM